MTGGVTGADRPAESDRARPRDVDSVPLHIGFVVYGDLETTSGGFRYDREVIRRLRDRGDTVDVISLPWRRYSDGVRDALDPTVRDRLDRDVDVLVQDGLAHPSVWRHNRTLAGPDAVVALVHHLRSDDPTDPFGALARPFERRFLRSVDAVVTTSRFTRKRATRRERSIATTPTLVARPAGRAEGPATTATAVRDRAGNGPLHVVFVGTVVPRKNPTTLLDALAGLDDDTRDGHAPDWRLTVVGSHDVDPAYAARVVERAAALGVDDRVSFVGELSDVALAETFEDAHVCCVPARYEAFGMVHLEAIEHGVVPVAGAVGGTGEFVRDGVNGFLVDPDDDRAIADRLRRLAADRDRLAELGVAALSTAEAHPTWEETTDRLRAFLATVAREADSGDRSPARGDRR
ncbi:hypothetical protein JCM18237_30120 [Halorubrum luteum]